ncbi:hypothetical protein LOAG_07500 [Loa loa]|uniref:Uncharacterized protein n=1 Tax=Loa loa TaxID=7209 RepID=A0A1S0TVG3_LOALO|nr:hypothetical protein LOAG_07500 [Loa loa]EFO20986.1 hypothetical protein LOAG_07500 [Loa loa]
MSYIAPFLRAIFSLLIIRSVVLQESHLNFLKSLGNNPVNWLHDFVRRGKGSVSKLPFDEIFIDQSDSDTSSISTVANILAEIAEANTNVVKIGADVSHLLLLGGN